MRKFDKNDPLEDAYRIHLRMERTARILIALWIASMVLAGGIVGAVVYVAWHFISKAW